MKNELTIKEKYSQYWPAVAVVSGVMAIVLFGAYIYASDVLFEGYLRLGAFACFALSFLSFFKIYDGQIVIDIHVDRELDVLTFTYSIRDRIIYEEEIGINNITGLKITEMPNRSLYNDFFTNDRTLRYQRSDGNNWLYLNEIYGRIVPLTKENAATMKKFIDRFTE